jgi:hypothetical protein
MREVPLTASKRDARQAGHQRSHPTGFSSRPTPAAQRGVEVSRMLHRVPPWLPIAPTVHPLSRHPGATTSTSHAGGRWFDPSRAQIGPIVKSRLLLNTIQNLAVQVNRATRFGPQVRVIVPNSRKLGLPFPAPAQPPALDVTESVATHVSGPRVRSLFVLVSTPLKIFARENQSTSRDTRVPSLYEAGRGWGLWGTGGEG